MECTVNTSGSGEFAYVINSAKEGPLPVLLQKLYNIRMRNEIVILDSKYCHTLDE